MKANITIDNLTFRPLSDEHLPTLFRWLNSPHLIAHWDKAQSLEDVRCKYGPKQRDTDQGAFIVMIASRPCAYIQFYWAARVGAEW